MIDRGNPTGIQATGEIPQDAVTEQIKRLHRRIQDAESERTMWLDKQKKLIEQRRGIRKKKATPWPGANNDNWPITDGTLRRWKPGIVSLILDSDPVAYFWAKRPDHIDAARSTQDFFHWLFHDMEDVKYTATKLADYVGLHGLGVTHEGWDYHIERTCRVVPVKTLFPDGVEAAVEQMNAQIRIQNEQLAVAAVQNPDQELPPPMAELSPDQLVRTVLQTEYQLDEVDEEQLAMATQKILAGAEYVKIYYMSVARDKPAWQAFSPLDVIFPSRTPDPEKGDYVALAYRMSEDDIRKMVRDGQFDGEAAEAFISKMRQARAHQEANPFDGRFGGARGMITDELDSAEGLTTVGKHNAEPGLEVVWKVYCKLDVNGDGILERVVMWYAPKQAIVLAIHDYPFPFEEWPVTFYFFEKNDDRPYSSRGVAELLHTFQKQTNKLHNARLDAIQILLAPMFKVKSTGNQINRNIKFRPGQFIPVKDQNDFTPVQMDMQPLFHFLQEENFTKTLAEQYIGVFDSSLLQPTSSERRTATEVEAITAQISSVFTLDATLFQASFARSLMKLWKLWREYGKDEVYFRVTGEEQPKLVRKSDIAYDYDIQPAGTPANTNKALALARSREALQLFAADMSGLINRHELYKNYFELTDRNLAKRIVRAPEEAALFQQMLSVVQAAGQEPAPPP